MGQVPLGKSVDSYSLILAAVLLLGLVLCPFTGSADTGLPAEADEFERAYGLYHSRQYDKAAGAFVEFLKDYPESTAKDSVLYWQAKSLLHLRRTEEAAGLFRTLVRQYSGSKFSGFARQELEVLKETAASVPPGRADTTTQGPAPIQSSDQCAGYLKTADDKIRSLSERLAESYTRNQFLEDELKVMTGDKQYLRGLLDEVRHGRQELPKNPAGAGRLEAENERLQQEIRRLSASQAASEAKKVYDPPVLRIGGRRYKLSEVIEENIISARVLSKMEVGAVPWRRNSPHEDFAVEQILQDRAGDGFLRARRADLEKLAAQYGFDGREEVYLIKYLSIDDLIKRRVAEQVVDEARKRKYYEENRNLYTTGKSEKTVASLGLPFTADTKFDGAILMTEIQAEAAGGKPFDSFVKTAPGGLILRQKGYDDLPSWIQEKLQGLEPGGTSSVIATDDQYMIFRVLTSGPLYRSYEEVRDSIRDSLASSYVLGPWLEAIRREAEIIR